MVGMGLSLTFRKTGLYSPLNEEGSRKTASFFFVDNQAFRLVGILVYKGLNLVLGSLSPLDKNPIGKTCHNVC